MIRKTTDERIFQEISASSTEFGRVRRRRGSTFIAASAAIRALALPDQHLQKKKKEKKAIEH